MRTRTPRTRRGLRTPTASELLDQAQLTDGGAAEFRFANRSVRAIARAGVDRQCPFVLLVGEQVRLLATGRAQRVVRGAEQRKANAIPPPAPAPTRHPGWNP